MAPEGWFEFIGVGWEQDSDNPTKCGRKVHDEVVEVNHGDDGATPVLTRLRPHLQFPDEGLGQVRWA